MSRVATSCPPAAKSCSPAGGSTSDSPTTSSLVTDETLRSAFLPITAWTFFFAFATTVLNFALGLFLALTLSEPRMGGKGIYRVLLIIPYGLPALLMTLVWKGMLNTDFGVINSVLGSNIPWLNDPWLARFSVLAVNLWLGFPYFFLVCSGALTAIPADRKEAAYVDGASGRYTFRTVVLPLLLVATAPLLVTTFAFNFNNYTLIQAAHRRRTLPWHASWRAGRLTSSSTSPIGRRSTRPSSNLASRRRSRSSSSSSWGRSRPTGSA